MARFYENLVVKRGYASAVRQTKLDAIAGKIDGVTEATWMAFALIENESSAPADAGQPAVEEAIAHEKTAEPATPGPAPPGRRIAAPCPVEACRPTLTPSSSGLSRGSVDIRQDIENILLSEMCADPRDKPEDDGS